MSTRYVSLVVLVEVPPSFPHHTSPFPISTPLPTSLRGRSSSSRGVRPVTSTFPRLHPYLGLPRPLVAPYLRGKTLSPPTLKNGVYPHVPVQPTGVPSDPNHDGSHPSISHTNSRSPDITFPSKEKPPRLVICTGGDWTVSRQQRSVYGEGVSAVVKRTGRGTPDKDWEGLGSVTGPFVFYTPPPLKSS